MIIRRIKRFNESSKGGISPMGSDQASMSFGFSQTQIGRYRKVGTPHKKEDLVGSVLCNDLLCCFCFSFSGQWYRER